MHNLLSSTLLLTIILVSTHAAPSKRDANSYGKSHRTAVESAVSNPKDGVKALEKMRAKYNWEAPVAVHEGLATNGASTQVNEKLSTGQGSGSGETTATPVVHDSEYLCPVTIGGQTLNLDVDTGSADLWVFNSGLPSSDTSGRIVYNPSSSNTYVNVQSSTFGVNYGDGSQTYGTVGTDTVVVAGITVQGQAIELPTAVSPSFTSDTNSDGILGLGFKSSNGIKPSSQPTWFENAMPNLQAPLFTANLKANTAGNYQFGVIDNTAYSGSLSYTPVNNSQGLWQFETSGSPGIADTGSSLLLLDDDIVREYWKVVDGHTSDDQGIIFPCTSVLPDFRIALGSDYTATIAGSLINYAPATTRSGYCFGGIQSNTGQGLNIFGDIMFASQFVVFDYGNMRIGFAPHAS